MKPENPESGGKNPEVKLPHGIRFQQPPPPAYKAEDIEKLCGLARQFKIQVIRLPGIELVFHPAAFVDHPAVAHATAQPAKQKTPEELKREEDALLFHSA